jgi:hypothetical protein
MGYNSGLAKTAYVTSLSQKANKDKLKRLGFNIQRDGIGAQVTAATIPARYKSSVTTVAHPRASTAMAAIDVRFLTYRLAKLRGKKIYRR